MKQYVSRFSGKELDERLTKVDDIPTKTSELNNDSGFISEAEADNKYTDKNKTGVLEKDIKDLKDRIDVEIPTKISQLENDKKYITDSEVQNKLNNLNNTVDYFGDIIELNITSKGGNIDSVEVNEGVLVDTLLTKANLDENGKIITSQLPDYILGQVMFGGLIYSDGTITASSNFKSKYGNDTNISANEASKYNGVYFIVTGEVVNMTIAGVSQVSTGDWIISVGDSWKKIDNSDAVTSVAGLVGNVNASSLAAVLADLSDENALVRKRELGQYVTEIELRDFEADRVDAKLIKKQDILVSGQNIKTVNGETLLGEGDITIKGSSLPEGVIDENGYLYSNGEKVDMRFTRSLLPVGTNVPASANLNTIEFLKIGKYYCSLNVDAKTIKNCPVNVAFSMEVFNPLGTNVDDETTREYTYRLRVLTQYDTGQQYMQLCRTNGTPGSWIYESWYVTPRVKFALASSKNDGTAAIGATNKGVYIDSTGEIKAMSYTVAKSVPSNAVFTDTNTKVTAVENHYTPAEDESQQIDAPSGEVVTGIKRDAAGHVVGVVTTPQTSGGDSIIVETDPVFSASPAATITNDKISTWDGKQDAITDLNTIRQNADDGESAYRAILDGDVLLSDDVAKVATSGSYNDLIDTPTIPSEQVNADWNATSGKAQILNKPTIPSAVTESTISGWGFTKNTGTYSKPSTGIPKTDLSSGVQTSLGKADTAIQSTSFGELTDLAVVKGFESAQNGTVYALPDCDTGDEDDILLSRGSVKTINGQSIVGRGDIEIGGSYNRVYTDAVEVELQANTYTVVNIPVSDSVVITLSDVNNATLAAEYVIQFQVDATSNGAELIVPDGVVWADGVLPAMTNGKTYELSFVDNLATFLEF